MPVLLGGITGETGLLTWGMSGSLPSGVQERSQSFDFRSLVRIGVKAHHFTRIETVVVEFASSHGAGGHVCPLNVTVMLGPDTAAHQADFFPRVAGEGGGFARVGGIL